MSPIQFALSEIEAIIPREILLRAFTPPSYSKYQRPTYSPNSIEDRIRAEVIDKRIRNYVNLQGAQEIVISLTDLPIHREDSNLGWWCHIPKTKTKGRRIIAVSSLVTGYMSNTGFVGSQFAQYGKDVYHQGVNEIMNNARPLELNATAAVYLIDENTIYCEDMRQFGQSWLRCTVESDEEFSFLTGNFLAPFAELCVLACKAYIYRTLSIALDKGQIESGVEVGSYREWVDRYSDAEEQFQDFLKEKWRKIQRMADKVKRHNHLKLITSPL